MSEIVNVNSAVIASSALVNIGPNIVDTAALSGDISPASSQSIALSSQSSQTSIIAGSYSSGSIALSEFGDKMVSIILALIEFLFGDKQDDEKKKLGLLSLLALAGGSQAQSSSYIQFTQYSALSQASFSSTQMVNLLADGSAWGQGAPIDAAGGMGSAIGAGIDVNA